MYHYALLATFTLLPACLAWLLWAVLRSGRDQRIDDSAEYKQSFRPDQRRPTTLFDEREQFKFATVFRDTQFVPYGHVHEAKDGRYLANILAFSDQIAPRPKIKSDTKSEYQRRLQS